MQKYSKRVFMAINQTLAKDEIWEERMAAMAKLQELAAGVDEKTAAAFVAGFDTAAHDALVEQVRFDYPLALRPPFALTSPLHSNETVALPVPSSLVTRIVALPSSSLFCSSFSSRMPQVLDLLVN